MVNANTLQTELRPIFASYGIKKAVLFGSVSKGTNTENSDIDIMVVFVDGPKIGFRFAGMVCELEDLLQRNVDLVVEGSLLPFAAASAEHDKELIYERAKLATN